MNKLMRQLAQLGVGAKLSAFSFVLIALVFGVFVWAVGYATTNMLEQRAIEEITVRGKLAVDTTRDETVAKSLLLGQKVGKTGGYFVLDATPGANYGRLLIAATKEGQNVLEEKAGNGQAYIKDILAKKNGVLTYTPAGSREKIAAFSQAKDKNWVVVGETFRDEITEEATSLRNLFALAGLAALSALAVILYLVIRNTLSQPLALATQVARQLAEGDLTTRLETKRNDEIGQLLNAINGIGQGLANVVWNIRHGTETLATATGEIAAGNLDLSSRTEQQASSLEKTASSMEQMTSTVKQNADNASQANQLARTASEVAVKGGAVVSEVVHTMDSINQSSKKIVDIISVIDSIAFQTNILALNAAVEAARAGEQGRGFAVVASEVRTLAQRSAAAAKEVKELIDESVNNVQNGSKLVAHAGATMEEVVASIKSVYDIMSEITSASREQSIGIEQVNQAITQMDQVTQQNAALVEQAAAAAESLQSQTTELNTVVSIFKIKSGKHGTKDEAVDMVKRAVEAIGEEGRDQTFAEINNKLGRYTDRDLYVVVYDMNGRSLAHGAKPEQVGKDCIDAKDGAGNLFVRERVALMTQQDQAWQDYIFLNPISKQMEQKSMYLERYGDLIVGCGIYKEV